MNYHGMVVFVTSMLYFLGILARDYGTDKEDMKEREFSYIRSGRRMFYY